MSLKAFSTLGLSAVFVTLTAQAEPDQDFINRAYDTCIMHMSHHITPTGDEPLSFASVDDVVMADDYEVLISFPAGAISGADYDKPNELTGMTSPAGSCIAYPKTGMIVRVVVDGKVVNKHEIAVN